MIVYRISSPKWANDVSGTGAKLYGGRWNSPGLPMLYTSENISLCMLEILVNAQRTQLKAPFVLVEIDIPENIIEPNINDLPEDWDIYPHALSTTKFGDNWLQSHQSLGIKVPSSTNKFESNILLNPLHQNFEKVAVKNTFQFNFEQRLFQL
ncbi:MAG: RES family NAD+ phosphorylase [Bacteroidia bacterium]